MKYCILSDSQKNKGQKVGLADRSKTRSEFWTENIKLAKVFDTKDEADLMCSKLVHNNPMVVRFHTATDYLDRCTRSSQDKIKHKIHSFFSKAAPQKSKLELALEAKERIWHDDDWCESY